jgi:hypothetical protein
MKKPVALIVPLIIGLGGFVGLVISVIGYAWAQNYLRTHQLVGMAQMIGYKDNTYSLASWVSPLSIGGIIISVIVLIGGVVTLVVAASSASKPRSYADSSAQGDA